MATRRVAEGNSRSGRGSTRDKFALGVWRRARRCPALRRGRMLTWRLGMSGEGGLRGVGDGMERSSGWRGTKGEHLVGVHPAIPDFDSACPALLHSPMHACFACPPLARSHLTYMTFRGRTAACTEPGPGLKMCRPATSRVARPSSWELCGALTAPLVVTSAGDPLVRRCSAVRRSAVP